MKKDPFASCGNCLHMYWSFKYKARFCKKAPFGDPLQIHEWCPDWEADRPHTSGETVND